MENLSHGVIAPEVHERVQDCRAAAVGCGCFDCSVARSCEIDPGVLHRWRRDFQQAPEHAFPGLGKKRADENQVGELERKIGQQALEIDFLKRCLQRIEEQRMLQALSGKPLSTGRSGKK